MKKWIAFALVAVLAVGIFVGCEGLFGKKDPAATDAAAYSDEELETAIKALGAKTDTAIEAGDPRFEQVIATCGDYKLTNSNLQYFYWMEFINFATNMSNYGVDISYFGIDTSKPFSEQDSLTEGMTWEQYFLQSALKTFHTTAASAMEAKKAGFALPDDVQQYIDALPETLESQAQSYGYADGLSYVQESFGAGATPEGYAEYVQLYYYAGYYQNEIYESIEYTDEDLADYFRANEESMTSAGITMDDDISTVNVRHILVTWEDADGDGTPTEEEKEAAYSAAESLLTEYEKNPTEDNFAALANEHSTDPGSNTNGGLYEDVHPGQMVTNFNDWCFDKSRAYGDTGIVETDYGYHIMFYVSKGDTPYWKTYVLDNGFRSDKMNARISDMESAYPMSLRLDDIVLTQTNIYGE